MYTSIDWNFTSAFTINDKECVLGDSESTCAFLSNSLCIASEIVLCRLMLSILSAEAEMFQD
jgi:hypothetical protein